MSSCWRTRQDITDDRHSPPQLTPRQCREPASRTDAFPIEPFYYQLDGHDSYTAGVGARETISTARALQQSHLSAGHRRPNTPAKGTRSLLCTTEDDSGHP